MTIRWMWRQIGIVSQAMDTCETLIPSMMPIAIILIRMEEKMHTLREHTHYMLRVPSSVGKKVMYGDKGDVDRDHTDYDN